MIKRIISGGQTGADQGALRAAFRLKIETGGWAPQGFRTESGLQANLLGSTYGLKEHPSYDYPPRTEANVREADATVIFGRRSVGSNLTERICRQLGKPCAWVFLPLEHKGSDTTRLVGKLAFKAWVKRNGVYTLNCAGNRESVNPGIEENTFSFLLDALRS